MSAMAAKTQEIVGKDQDGRDVYADKSVVVPGSLRPDGTRRKDLRVRAEQRPDGSWRSFVPQDEVKKYAVRARRPANPPGAAAGPPLPAAALRELVVQLTRAMEAAPPDEEAIGAVLAKLEGAGMTLDLLRETGVGKTVNALKKLAVAPALAGRARALVDQWKTLQIKKE